MTPRLRAACDLLIPAVRESAGHHEYDGRVPDLSPDGVHAALDRLGGAAIDDPAEEAHLAAFEEGLRAGFGELALHRRNPAALLAALDLAVYDKDYAPIEERADARRRHLAAWPAAIDAGLAALTEVPAPVAAALLPAVRGLAAAADPRDEAAEKPLAAHARLVAHLERAAAIGEKDPALGGPGLARLMGASEALEVDLGRLVDRVERERDRLTAMLRDACGELRPGATPRQVLAEALADHPSAVGVLEEARVLAEEAIAFTRDRGLVGEVDGECVVAPSPPSRRWATASLSWAAPGEVDGPSFYFITPPDPAWPARQQRQWLSAYNRTFLPVTTVHEVAPGHFAHGRHLRRVEGEVRRTLQSSAFIEGWGHYAEELLVEEGFRGGDPRYRLAVAVKALLRITRLAVALGIHTRTMTLEEAVARFERDAFYLGPAAQAEANRALFDPTYGRYTWGKLEILTLRDAARARWGSAFTLPRFHRALLSLGAPPLGLLHLALGEQPAAA